MDEIKYPCPNISPIGPMQAPHLLPCTDIAVNALEDKFQLRAVTHLKVPEINPTSFRPGLRRSALWVLMWCLKCRRSGGDIYPQRAHFYYET